MELQNYYGALQETGAELAVLVVAPIEALNEWCQQEGVSYPVLADSAHEVSEAYGVYNLFGSGRAAPSVFIVDTDGSVVWHYVGKHTGDQVNAQTIIDHLP